MRQPGEEPCSKKSPYLLTVTFEARFIPIMSSGGRLLYILNNRAMVVGSHRQIEKFKLSHFPGAKHGNLRGCMQIMRTPAVEAARGQAAEGVNGCLQLAQSGPSAGSAIWSLLGAKRTFVRTDNLLLGPAKSRRRHRLLLGKVTQHWFRHRLATLMLRKDPRAAMEQGGWLDIRSVIGYSHDVPEYRRQLVAEMDDSPDQAPQRDAR